MLIDSGSLQVADAPLARQSSAASGEPSLSAAAEALWRRRLATKRRACTHIGGNYLLRYLDVKGAVRFFTLCVFLSIVITTADTSATPRGAAAGVSATPPVIVVGFLGGFVKHDNPVHSEVQLAARLRKEYPAGVDVETFESYRGAKARQKILELLDADHDGTLSVEEKQDARVILYGHSWGASEIITLARKLKKDGIPVLLTIQVDSVSKIGQNDEVIPTNVAQAANFYQPNGIVHGEREIRPADPAHTRIIGNFRFDYKASPYTCNEYPWFDHILAKHHTQIECDPKVWDQVESLIRSNIVLAGSPSEFSVNK